MDEVSLPLSNSNYFVIAGYMFYSFFLTIFPNNFRFGIDSRPTKKNNKKQNPHRTHT